MIWLKKLYEAIAASVAGKEAEVIDASCDAAEEPASQWDEWFDRNFAVEYASLNFEKIVPLAYGNHYTPSNSVRIVSNYKVYVNELGDFEDTLEDFIVRATLTGKELAAAKQIVLLIKRTQKLTYRIISHVLNSAWCRVRKIDFRSIIRINQSTHHKRVDDPESPLR